MKRSTLLPITALVLAVALTSCTPEETPEEALFGLCTGVVSDDAALAKALFTEAMSSEALCGCYSKSVVAEGEKTIDLHIQVMDAVVMARTSQGLGAEEAAEAISDSMVENADSYAFTESQLETVGTYLSDISAGFSTNPLCTNLDAETDANP